VKINKFESKLALIRNFHLLTYFVIFVLVRIRNSQRSYLSYDPKLLANANNEFFTAMQMIIFLV